MGNFDDCCLLFWSGGQKTVTFSFSTNVPTFFMAPSLRLYQMFAATYEAMEAPFFQRETVLQVPGRSLLREDTKITPKKFVADEDFNCCNRERLIDNKINKNDDTICTSNVPDPSERMIPPTSLSAVGPPPLIHRHQ
jgi:hypothetical protein